MMQLASQVDNWICFFVFFFYKCTHPIQGARATEGRLRGVILA